MAASFFFYDLETSGLNSREDRIMQFAGQRTDMNLNPIGEPLNLLVTLTDEVLPEPAALMVTHITPQQTKDEGYTEAQFLKIISDEVLTPDTIIVGYNNVKFDDEFMRCSFFRNMYDPYDWQLGQGRSRWDLLDVVRLTRALRPEGITWPVDADGVPTNRLEEISKANGLEHEHAHDALSDVIALIDVAKLIKSKQPKLYDYFLNNRDKTKVDQLVGKKGEPFIFTTYVYPKEFFHTSAATAIAPGTYNGAYFVYDLRHDPTEWIAMSASELRAHCQLPSDERPTDHQFLPVRELKTNQCPAVAPYSILQASKEVQERLGLDQATIKKHLQLLKDNPDFGQRAAQAMERTFEANPDPECQLYDGFIPQGDKAKMARVRQASFEELRGLDPGFTDKRLQKMLTRYKARNFPGALTDSERAEWEAYRTDRLQRTLPRFAAELEKAVREHPEEEAKFILEELQLYAQAIVPVVDEAA